MKDKINKIFAILENENPAPHTELNYTNNFTLLVAIVLSAQSTDVGVNKVTHKLFKEVIIPEDIIKMGIDKLKNYIKTLGLYNSKAKNILLLAQELISRHNSIVPDNLEALEKLSGVGSKTARVFLNCAHNVPIIAVDTHVFRVSKRLGLTTGKTVKEVEKELNLVIPDKWKLHAHHWLILHGRYICKAKKPSCSTCKIRELCQFYQQTNQ